MTTEDKTQDQEIIRLRDSLKGKVPWAVFVWAIAILIGSVGFSVSSSVSNDAEIRANVERSATRITTVENQMSSANAKLDLLLGYFKLSPKDLK